MPRPQTPIAHMAPPQDDVGRRGFAAELKRRAARNKRRRERYETDAAYRAVAIAAALQFNRRSKRRLTGGEDERAWRSVLVRHAVTKDLCRESVGTLVALSRALRVRREAIVRWEQRGLLPPPAYMTAHGWRLYTPEMIDAAADAHRTSGMARRMRRGVALVRGREVTLFRAMVHERWDRLRAGMTDWALAGEEQGDGDGEADATA